jgi:hypothetical protein
MLIGGAIAGSVVISKTLGAVVVIAAFVLGAILLFVKEPPPPPQEHIHKVERTLDNPRGRWSKRWFE